MLWEADDPDQALADRFGFHDFAAVTDWLSTTIAELWGIEIRACSRLAISDHNAIAWVKGADDRNLIVKWSMERSLFDRLHASTEVLSHVAEAGAPVAAPHRSRDGSIRVEAEGPAGPLSVAVLPELSGDWLDTSDLSAVKAAGSALARVHHHLGEITDIPEILGDSDDSVAKPGSDSVSPNGQAASAGARIFARISKWLDPESPLVAPQSAEILRHLLATAPDFADEPQLVHRDFRAANILTRGSEVFGILDFDDIATDYRVRDLAQASVYLSTRFRDWAPTTRTVQSALRVGYEAVRPLEPSESAWFDILLLWQSLGAVTGPDDTMGWAASANSLATELSTRAPSKSLG